MKIKKNFKKCRTLLYMLTLGYKGERDDQKLMK